MDELLIINQLLQEFFGQSTLILSYFQKINLSKKGNILNVWSFVKNSLCGYLASASISKHNGRDEMHKNNYQHEYIDRVWLKPHLNFKKITFHSMLTCAHKWEGC